MAAERKSLAELRETREYQRLTPKQQLWTATYCEGGLATGKYDAVAATLTAFKCKSAETARTLSYQVMGSINIIAVLNLHFGVSPTEELLNAIERAIHNRKITMAQVYALRTKCEALGILTRLPSFKDGTRGIERARRAIAPPKKTAAAKKSAKGPTFVPWESESPTKS